MRAISDPKAEGSEAFLSGKSTSSCDYADGSSRKMAWLTGWTDGQMERRLPAEGPAVEGIG